MLAVAAGLSLGKEGPMVHIAICLGKTKIETQQCNQASSIKEIAVVILICMPLSFFFVCR